MIGVQTAVQAPHGAGSHGVRRETAAYQPYRPIGGAGDAQRHRATGGVSPDEEAVHAVAVEHRENLIGQQLSGVPGHPVAVTVPEREHLNDTQTVGKQARLRQVRASAVQVQHHQRRAIPADTVGEAMAVEIEVERFAGHTSTLPRQRAASTARTSWTPQPDPARIEENGGNAAVLDAVAGAAAFSSVARRTGAADMGTVRARR